MRDLWTPRRGNGPLPSLAPFADRHRSVAWGRGAGLLLIQQQQQLLQEFGLSRHALGREGIDTEQLAMERRERRIAQDQAMEAGDHPWQEGRILLHDRVLLGGEPERAFEERPV